MARKLKLCNDKAGYDFFGIKFINQIFNFLNSNKEQVNYGNTKRFLVY